MGLTLEAEPAVSPHRLRYCVLRPAGDGPVVPAGVKQLGVWLYGNAAAMVDFELLDAKGQRWTTVQHRPAYSFGVSYRGRQAFEGWKYVTFALPAPGVPHSPWHGIGKAGATIALPAKITGLVVEQFGQTIYVNRLADPITPQWRVGDIVAE